MDKQVKVVCWLVMAIPVLFALDILIRVIELIYTYWE